MENKKINLLMALVLIGLPFLYASYLYPSLPNTIPTHFNLSGEADGWGGKGSIFLGPSIMGATSLFVYFILVNLKSIDPKKYNIANDGLYKKIALFTVGFLSVLGLVIIHSSSDTSGSIKTLLLPLLGVGFWATGIYLPKLHQNYFAGFKLPWTLENADNWNATHRLAGKIWMYGGIAQVITGVVFETKLAFIFFFILLSIMVIIPTIFSYNMFKGGNKTA